MFSLLWIVPALPFAGFLILALLGSRLSRSAVATIGVGAVGLSALVAVALGLRFMIAPPFYPAGHVYYAQTLWTWMNLGTSPALSYGASHIGFYLDSFSVVMMLVVTVIGFLIHVYSVEYMAGDDGYARFFAYMNLFVGSMLVLVLADNLLLLYLGWEGVGLCSYLLIGFWYTGAANGRAAFKAFLVTRVGDTAMALGLFLLLAQFKTLQIGDILTQAPLHWRAGSGMAVAAAALLLAGAVGKSGQIPLQVWLPDAMAGPTPVSALIHAATMVTAGVYLIARMHVLFELAPVVQTAVAIIGAATLLIAGVSAMAQRDIKRVLAYSTISQIGYMFLALGVGAWSAAIFHLVTHAFFKALLFLSAGAVILALHHEQDMFKMGGLRKQLPVVFWTFLIGAMSLAALPLVTAGFYSKDAILWAAWSSQCGSRILWGAGALGAGLTSLYTFRMVFLTFFGEAKTLVTSRPGKWMTVPLILLAVGATLAGFLEVPRTFGYRLGDVTLFSTFTASSLPRPRGPHASLPKEYALLIIAQVIVFGGIAAAYVFFLRSPERVRKWASGRWGAMLHRFAFSGCGFDWLYDHVFVRPFLALAEFNKDDFIDKIYAGIAAINVAAHRRLSRTQTGLVRWYMMGIAAGAVILLALVLLL